MNVAALLFFVKDTSYDFSRDCGMMVDMYLTDEAGIKADLMLHIATCLGNNQGRKERCA